MLDAVAFNANRRHSFALGNTAPTSLAPSSAFTSSKDEQIGGRFAGLEPDGALRLLLDDGSIEVIRAGDVFLS